MKNSEPMFPESWQSRIAADCFLQISTTHKKIKTKDCNEIGLYPVIDQGQASVAGYIDDPSKVIELDSPLCIFGDHTRVVKWVDRNFVPGADGTKVLQPLTFLSPRFAYHQLCNMDIPDKGYSRHFKYFKELWFGIPPLAEQKVIAEKLDTLLAQVETTKARLESTLETLKQFRQSVLAAAVSGKLTEDWREQSNQRTKEQLLKELLLARKNRWIDEQVKNAARQEKIVSKDSLVKKYKAPSQAYLDELNLTLIHEVPDSWLVTNLDSVAIAVTGKTPSTKDERYWRGDIPFISPSQISPEGHILEPERYVTELGSTKSPVLPEGSILIVCIGTIGKVGLLDRECVFNQQINALIPSSAIKKEFLYMWAKTLHSWLNKTSSAVVNAAIINKSRLCSAPCPLPSIEEQEEIVIRAEKLFLSAHVAEQKVNQALERVNNLTQSILAKAFCGELTEQWRKDNPDLISGDNSAEALLKKIKAEREAAKPKRKTTK